MLSGFCSFFVPQNSVAAEEAGRQIDHRTANSSCVHTLSTQQRRAKAIVIGKELRLLMAPSGKMASSWQSNASVNRRHIGDDAKHP